MAGLTSTFSIKTLVSRPNSPSVSPHSSKLFVFRFYSPKYSLFSTAPIVSSPSNPISVRYAIEESSSPSGAREPRRSSPDEDEALDISTIRSDNVRLIDERQNMVGIVPKSSAIQMAEDAELDLVILSPDADPPVVRIMDYTKYKYELQKKKREQQKKSAANRMGLKELKMGYNIDVHDYAVRLRAAQKFLKDGDKVKLIVNLKGRENQFRNNAIELIRRFRNDVGELAIEEAKSLRDKNMFIVLVPNKAVVQKTQELPKKVENPVVSEVSASV